MHVLGSQVLVSMALPETSAMLYALAAFVCCHHESMDLQLQCVIKNIIMLDCAVHCIL